MSRMIPIIADPDYKTPEGRNKLDKPTHLATVCDECNMDDEAGNIVFSRRERLRDRGLLRRFRTDIEHELDGRDSVSRFNDDFDDPEFWESRFHGTRKTSALIPGNKKWKERKWNLEKSFSKTGEEDEFVSVPQRLIRDDDLEDFPDIIKTFRETSKIRGRNPSERRVTSEWRGVSENPRRHDSKLSESEFMSESPWRHGWGEEGDIGIPIPVTQQKDEGQNNKTDNKNEDELEPIKEGRLMDSTPEKTPDLSENISKGEAESAVMSLKDKTSSEQEQYLREKSPGNNDNNSSKAICLETEKRQEKEQAVSNTSSYNVSSNLDDTKSEVISKINAIEKIVESLQGEVEGLSKSGSGKNSNEYCRLEEMLTRCMLDLDQIEALGDQRVRDARKSAVNHCQDALDKLEVECAGESSP
ncbi:uncharacterized protein LOC5501463 [Nematostella vectensis]|uniref:uncharacterized protein LOC5501463 n=1 Tax=Nematostella vectensis TaxID=45351 RepID=UPI002077314C|nr:uncharacterized protein LOC5501463 [Nematostella vectensis]